MGEPALIPGIELIYRGMRQAKWVQGGIVNYLAYMLRPATAQFPEPETELSVALTTEKAVGGLSKYYGIAGLSVEQVHALRYHLAVRSDPTDELLAAIHGLPLHSYDEVQIGLAIAAATDLADISPLVPMAMPQ